MVFFWVIYQVGSTCILSALKVTCESKQQFKPRVVNNKHHTRIQSVTKLRLQTYYKAIQTKHPLDEITTANVCIGRQNPPQCVYKDKRTILSLYKGSALSN